MIEQTQLFPFTTMLAQDTGVPDFGAIESGATSGSAPAEGVAATGADGQPIGQPGAGTPTKSPFGDSFILIMLAGLAFLFIMSMFSGKKQKKQRAAMLTSLSKHDRVMTNGGMMGTIVEIKDSELVLRIDDSTGAKAHFTRDAVAHVMKSSSGPADD